MSKAQNVSSDCNSNLLSKHFPQTHHFWEILRLSGPKIFWGICFPDCFHDHPDHCKGLQSRSVLSLQLQLIGIGALLSSQSTFRCLAQNPIGHIFSLRHLAFRSAMLHFCNWLHFSLDLAFPRGLAPNGIDHFFRKGFKNSSKGKILLMGWGAPPNKNFLSVCLSVSTIVKGQVRLGFWFD